MNRKTITILAGALMLASLFTGCAATDVVAKYAPNSLDAIVATQPEMVQSANGLRPITTFDHYFFTVDGQTVLSVISDFSAGIDDVLLATPFAPFQAAGLDAARLPEGYRVNGDALVIATDFGDEKGEADGFRAALFQAVTADRKALGYHQTLDHYGIKLRGGKFEWAKNYKTNDKDIVFVLFAKPLADLGVDVQNVEGWIFKTMDEPDGSKVDVLLLPYDLK